MSIHPGNLAGKGPLGLKGEKPAKKRKVKPLEVDAIRKSAKGETCTLRLPCCNHDDSTVTFNHLRVFGLAGVGQKPPDFAGVYGCSACHDAIDRRDGKTAGLWGFEDLLRALLETQRRLVAKGLLHLGRVE